MKDLRDPKERQRFLQERIDRNLKRSKTTTDRLASYSNMIGNLVEMFENKDEAEYRRLLKLYRLRA